ncbi:glycoside hydrolase family 25 protein [Kitasatospora sp. NPDC018058]|uniref:glycoside hydrolase family 25 protein n=1 Tax=Kitasatospora sp. NPDC018058 TaxID=3364025 RepID=UPI0037C1A9F0
MGIYGQDWASYQDAQPDTSGLSFVFTKITEGTSYINPRWVAQRDHAKASGLVWGGYHYPHMANSPQAEADYFLAQVNWRPGDLIVLDWEGYDPANQDVSRSAQLAYKEAWLRYVKSRMPNNPVGMYANVDYWKKVDTTGFYGDFLWIATVGRSAGDPGIQAPWLFHQYSDQPLDSDYCHLGSVGELRAWALSFAGSAPDTTAPAPTAPPTEETDMPLTDDDVNRVAQRVVYLLAQGLAGQAPNGADDNLKWLIDWYHQCSQSSMGAALDYKLGSAGVAGLSQKIDAAPAAVAQALASGITLTVNTTAKGA